MDEEAFVKVWPPRAHYTKGLLRSSPKAVLTSLSMYVPFVLEWSMKRRQTQDTIKAMQY
jgi:hypothetical protein